MAGIKDMFSANFRRAFAWTVCYAVIMWVILRVLFNFNMFSMAHWAGLAHLRLHGFAGMMFGILMLSAIPIYIATMVLTYRNKINPVAVLRPRCFDTPPAPEPPTPEPLVVEQDALPELPVGVPAEMREVFAAAKRNSAVRQKSVFNRPSKFGDSPTTTTVKEPINQTDIPKFEDMIDADLNPDPVPGDMDSNNGGLPIPIDFDVDVGHDDDVPVFADINFDDDDTVEDDGDVESKGAPEYAPIQELLLGAGHNTEMLGNLIVVDNFAIAVHNDDDFWVADENDWFAAGRQKPSPIVELQNAHTDKGLRPILYVGDGNNIMDFDKLAPQWRDSGIEIVTNTDELLKVITTTAPQG